MESAGTEERVWLLSVPHSPFYLQLSSTSDPSRILTVVGSDWDSSMGDVNPALLLGLSAKETEKVLVN